MTRAAPSREDGCFQVLVHQGQGEAFPLGGRASCREDADLLWIHLQRGDPRAGDLLRDAGLETPVLEALLAGETRPRLLQWGRGLLVVLRGVNLNPGADPEDMVSVRLWLEPGRVFSLMGRPMQAVDDLRDSLEAGQGPRSAAQFLTRITRAILDRMAPVLDELAEEGDGLEEEVLSRPKADLRRRVGQHRRQCIQLRRHLAPMREVVTALSLESDTLLDEHARTHLHESAERLIRIVEDLDALRDRAVVTHDELGASLSDQINSTMFRLSLIAAVFLPLSLITSLLGINVEGIPFARRNWAFLAVCLVLLGLGLVEGLVLYRRYWKRGRP